jgi:hypothetical protein
MINLKLSVNPIILKEVTIRSKDKNRLNNYTQFVKLFLGETDNSQSCKILNPEDLHLHSDDQTNVLTGFSVKPLQILNKALGYTILYDLTDFRFDPSTGLLRFSGNHYFQPISGSARNNKIWTRKRLYAYYGSKMHLFRAIFSDSLYKENFNLFEFKKDSLTNSNTNVLQVNNPILRNTLVKSQNSIYRTIYYNHPVLVSYKDNHPELYTGITGFQPKLNVSTIFFTDSIRIFRNGYFDNPYSITWGGDLSNERVGDLLPFDFVPVVVQTVANDSVVTNTPVEKYLLSQQKSKSADQVFVQLDRNMYRPGDSIYFQAYIRNRFTNLFETKSSSLYALLSDNNQVKIDSSRFRIINSTSTGWMTIPATAQPGKYHFAAFTARMQNYDPVDAFQLDLYVRALNNYQVVNNNAETSSVKQDSARLEDQVFELRFLPEGGVLVTGLPQRTGFNATNLKGEPVNIEGVLKDSTGFVLDTIRSGIYGPGQFYCIPQPGMYVELIKSVSDQKKWYLPEPVTKGIYLSVKPLNNGTFAIEIQSDNYSGDTIKVTGVMNSLQIFYQELVLNKKQRIVVETDQLLSGIVQITLFSKQMRPIAERLYYINPDKHLKFNIDTEKSEYRPQQETELKINVTDDQGNPASGIFSIAVVDSISGFNAEIYTPGIEYAFNYHPAFPGNLPSKVLAKGLENMSNEERDLILMVYGWSKYKWDFSSKINTEDKQVDYESLNMKIMYALKKNRADRRLDLISLEGPSVRHLVTNNEGLISLPLDSLPLITKSVTLLPNTDTKKKVMGAMLSIPYNEKYFKSNKLFTAQPVIAPDLNKHIPVSKNIPHIADAIEIPEVDIIGHPENKRIYHDKYEEEYQYADTRSLDPELLWTANSVSDALRRLMNPYLMNDNYVILRPPRSIITSPVPALVVLDGMPLYFQGWSHVNSLSASEVTSLTVLIGKQGYARYGEAAQGGIIFVNTRADNPSLASIRTKWLLQNKKDKMLLPISIYRPNIEFYSPAGKEIDIDPVLQSRSLIYWDPEISFNGKEPVTIKYTNLKRRGPVIITINGVSVANQFGTGRSGYTVY